MAVKVKVTGLRQLDRALGELPKSTGKAVLRRVLKKAAQPIADHAEALAPVDKGTLKHSIGVGTKLTSRQKAQHRKMFKSDKASVEMFAGAGGLPSAHNQEFGNEHNGPQPFMRPAWAATKMQVLDTIKDDLGDEIIAAAKRLAKRQAKLAAKG